MPTLHVERGPLQGQVIALMHDRTVLGRNPDCHVIIPSSVVSKCHAHILKTPAGFAIDDLKSRNSTFVNEQEVEPGKPVLLKHGDRVRICDFEARFAEVEEELADGSTVVEAALSSGSDLRLETQPADRLAALLGITAKLARTLELDAMLPEVADGLLRLFRQADRGFLILVEPETNNLTTKVVKTRSPAENGPPLFSHSIVRRCLQTGQALLIEDAGTPSSPEEPSHSVIASRIRSVMCVPLSDAEGTPFGVIQVDTQEWSKKFTEDDLRLLWGVGHQASLSLENARMHDARLAQDRVRRDLELARQVQRSFLPQGTPGVKGYEFFAFYEAAQVIGGDYYDFLTLPDGRLAVAIGDVAGKGIPAALLMARLSSDVRTCLLTHGDPAAAMACINDLLYPQTSAMDRFVTLALLVLDPATHRAVLVNAAHPSPVFCRRGGRTFEPAMDKRAAGVPLGMNDGSLYQPVELTLGPGDSLLLFSDGVTDAQSAAARPFHLDGLYATLRGGGPDSARSLSARVIDAVQRHAAGVPQHDDITLLCLGRTDG